VGEILQCVPNFSQGRDPAFRRELELVLASFPVQVLDLSQDADHNRADCTFLGAPAAVEACAAALCARALELIDMRTHTGSHPRMGAVDVVPFVPIRGVSMAEAVEIARRFGATFAERHGIPVFFYEEACTSEERRNLADVRRGEYEGMAAKLRLPEWTVDAGPQALNERSGVTAVGARMPLVAFNVNLGTDDLAVAKAIAAAVRHSSGGLRYVKAMGLEVAERGLVQVSMNLVDYRRTPIHRAVELVRIEAARHGVPVTECELVGLVPLEALEDVAGYYLQIPEFGSEKVIEYHLLADEEPTTSFRGATLAGFLEELSSGAATPGGGCASALSGALAAGLVAMVARNTAGSATFADRAASMDQIAAEADRLRGELEELIDADAAAFEQVMAAFRLPRDTPQQKAERSQEIQDGYKAAVDPPLVACRHALRVLELAALVAEQGSPNAVSDAGVAALLAASALDGAALNVEINLGSIKDDDYRTTHAEAVRELREQAAALREAALARVHATLG
jgi:glutamate formiminotransferase/formiminotetrahydrofolate cyclodeaminase